MSQKNDNKTITCDQTTTRFQLEKSLAQLLETVVTSSKAQPNMMRSQLESYAHGSD